MNQTFDEQLQWLMENDPEEYSMHVDTLNIEGVRIFYTIHSLGNDDFMLSASMDDYEDDYVTETDYSNLLLDFRNDIITEITIYREDGNVFKFFKPKILVDYTRKMPKKLEDCPICLDPLLIDICANRKCKHAYHCECISKWNNKTCPVCRRTLDLYKIQDINDYSSTAGFTLFGKISEIKYLKKILNGR
jgi:SUMO ligase MMS21 Smc5/6 complex component